MRMPTTICWHSCILSFWKNWDLLSTLTSRGLAPAFPLHSSQHMLYLGLHPLIPWGSLYSLLHSDSQFGQSPFWSLLSLTVYFAEISLTRWRASLLALKLRQIFPCFYIPLVMSVGFGNGTGIKIMGSVCLLWSKLQTIYFRLLSGESWQPIYRVLSAGVWQSVLW